MNDKILTKLRLRGYQPRAWLTDVELFRQYRPDEGGECMVARGVVNECFDHTWHRGEIINTTPIQEINQEEGWFITRNSLYLVESWAERSPL